MQTHYLKLIDNIFKNERKHRFEKEGHFSLFNMKLVGQRKKILWQGINTDKTVSGMVVFFCLLGLFFYSPTHISS